MLQHSGNLHCSAGLRKLSHVGWAINCSMIVYHSLWTFQCLQNLMKKHKFLLILWKYVKIYKYTPFLVYCCTIVRDSNCFSTHSGAAAQAFLGLFSGSKASCLCRNWSSLQQPTPQSLELWDVCIDGNLFQRAHAESQTQHLEKVKLHRSVSTMDCGLSRCSQKNLNQSFVAVMLELALSHWNFEHDISRFSLHHESTTLHLHFFAPLNPAAVQPSRCLERSEAGASPTKSVFESFKFRLTTSNFKLRHLSAGNHRSSSWIESVRGPRPPLTSENKSTGPKGP